MKRTLGALLLLLAVAGACVAAQRSRAATRAKPEGVVVRLARSAAPSHARSAPVSIEVVPGRVPAPGRQEVRVLVTPHVDAAGVEVKVTALDGIAVVEGPGRWPAAARARQPVTEELVLAVTGAGERHLVVTATLASEGGAKATAAATYTFNPQPPSTPSPRMPGAREVATPDGQAVLELPAKEAGVPDSPTTRRVDPGPVGAD